MVPRENAEAARIIGNRFMETELCRKIRDRFLDCRAGAGLSVSVMAFEIFCERVVDLFQFAEKSFVLRNFLEPRLPGKLQHSDRIVIRSVPKFRIEMTKEPSRGGLPSPPQVERHLAQWLERGRQCRRHIIGLKRGHGLQLGNRAHLIRKLGRGKCQRAHRRA